MHGAMNADIRWWADFARGRPSEWPDGGIRLRVLAIASVILLTSLATIVENVRAGLLTPDQIVYSIFALLFCLAAIGLNYRNRVAYFIAYLFTLSLFATLAVSVVWLPIFAGIAWNGQENSPTSPLTIVDIWAVIVLAIYIFIALRYYEFYAALRRVVAKLEYPIAGLVVVGGIFVIIWSGLDLTIGNAFVQAWMTNATYYASMRLGVVALLDVPLFAYSLWSYITLRSRAVRDAFSLP